MGIHHYHLDVLPRVIVEDHFELGHPASKIEDLEWLPGENEQPSPKFLSNLRELLPNDTSWGPVEEYESRNDWGSDLRIWHIDEPRMLSPVESIAFRFSPAGDPVELLHNFIKLAAEEDCVLISRGSDSWLEPALGVVYKNLKKSRAFLFAQDPNKTFDDLAKNPVKLPNFT